MKFSEMPYARPDLEGFKAVCSHTASVIRTSPDCEEVINAYRSYEKEGEHVSTMFGLAQVRHTLDTVDEFYAAENEFTDANGPIVSEWTNEVEQALLNAPTKEQLLNHFGPLFFTNLEIATRSFKPELVPLMQEENKLTTDYEVLMASAEVNWNGEMIPLTLLGKYKQDKDRAVRKKAFTLEGEFYEAHAKELDSLFDQLVHNRDQQAKLLGYKNYLQLGYDRLGRNCYGPKEVAQFRQMILDEIVPIAGEIKAAQAKRIGLSEIHLYDDNYWFQDGNANPKGMPDDILNAGKEMYHKLSPETGEYIDFMYDNELLDVLSKKGKAPGGYCTEFPEFKSPFVFANFNGTAADVDVLTHEVGHAFHAYRSFKNELEPSLANPTIEACEVHSMSMEFLTSPYHHAFFKEDTEKYAYYHAASSLTFIPYGCLVDDFQHKIYENPEMTPAERHELWIRLENQYRPYLHREEVPFYNRGAGWQRQIHIYENPLYYIDYCMAQTVAFDFWVASLENHEDAWKRYLTFVDLGGTKTFSELVEAAGFPVPYAPGAIKTISNAIREWLEKNAL